MTEELRIKRVYERTRELGLNPPQQTFNHDMHKFALEKYFHLPRWEKIARATADAVINQDILIEPQDKIIGRVFYSNEKPIEQFDPDFDYNARRNDMLAMHPEYAELCDFKITSWGMPGHIAWNWNLILTQGTAGLRELCQSRMERLKDDERAVEFFTGVLIMLDALDAWNDLHVKKLEEMGKFEEAEICRRVPKYPARSFREAVQSFFMQHIVVMKENPHGGNSPGRLDYYLWPYLESDMEKGIITENEAQILIEELFLRIDERIHKNDTWGESIVLGGTHPNGQSAVNPLSYIMIKAFMKYDITHPYLYASISKNSPKDFIKLCASYVINGNNRAQILNDEAIISALIKSGVNENDAHNYYCGGCMEIAIQGATSDLLFTGGHNLLQLLELCITGGYSIVSQKQLEYFPTKNLTDFNDFESFYDYFIDQCKRVLNLHLEYMDIFSEQAEISRPLYLISSMINDCMTKGRNIHGGGARYHDYGASFMGLANTADSLFAIKKAVFDYKICGVNELIAALKANFVGFEELHSRLLNLPKYGQENQEADDMMVRMTEAVSKHYLSYKNRFGGYGKPIILAFIWAPWHGAISGASADGRKSGAPLSHAVTPQSCAMTKGITSAMNSCTKLNFDLFPGGATTMWDLDYSWANEELVEWLVLSFFEQGGQFFQGNVTDVNELIKAQDHPEDYPHLIVRVGGFSARFVWLGKDVQDEIINRIRHGG